MEAKEYIINTIKQWLEKFEGIQIKFVYEESSDYYIVVVTPDSIFKNDSFKKEVFDLWNVIMQRFHLDFLVSEPDPSYNMSNILFDSAA